MIGLKLKIEIRRRVRLAVIFGLGLFCGFQLSLSHAQDLTAPPLESTRFTPTPKVESSKPEPAKQTSEVTSPPGSGPAGPSTNQQPAETSTSAPPAMLTKGPAWLPAQPAYDPQRDMMNRVLREIGKPRTSEGFDEDYIGPIEHYTSNDDETEAAFNLGRYCTSGKCDRGLRHQAGNLSAIEAAALEKATTGNICTDRLLKSMRKIAGTYDRRGPFSGKCALAVRQGLNASGIYRGGGLGNAKDLGPGLTRLGYENVFRPGKDAKSAPEGAILVYGKARRAGCRGLGSTYGHVEIKDFGGRFLYDGTAKKPMSQIHGPDCRPLIGIYVPGRNMRCK